MADKIEGFERSAAPTDKKPRDPRLVGALVKSRQDHINAETNIKSLGILMYVGAAGTLLNATDLVMEDPFSALIMAVFGSGLGLAGYWTRRLDHRGRAVYSTIVAISVIVMIFFAGDARQPGNSGAYEAGRMFWPLIILAMLWGAKARTVMTDYYREIVVPATPHVTRDNSMIKIVVGVLLLLLVVAAVFDAAIK